MVYMIRLDIITFFMRILYTNTTHRIKEKKSKFELVIATIFVIIFYIILKHSVIFKQ